MVAGELVKIEDLPEPQLEELKRKAIEPVEIEKTEKRSLIVTDDPKLNYKFGSSGTDIDIVYDEVTPLHKVDYNIITEEEAEKELNSDTKSIEEDTADKRNSLSYMSVNSVEEGIEWYRANFPKVPDDLLPLMARWSFGDLSEVTKKSIKNDTKRVKQGKKPKQKGLEVKQGPFVLEF